MTSGETHLILKNGLEPGATMTISVDGGAGVQIVFGQSHDFGEMTGPVGYSLTAIGCVPKSGEVDAPGTYEFEILEYTKPRIINDPR